MPSGCLILQSSRSWAESFCQRAWVPERACLESRSTDEGITLLDSCGGGGWRSRAASVAGEGLSIRRQSDKGTGGNGALLCARQSGHPIQFVLDNGARASIPSANGV